MNIYICKTKWKMEKWSRECLHELSGILIHLYTEIDAYIIILEVILLHPLYTLLAEISIQIQFCGKIALRNFPKTFFYTFFRHPQTQLFTFKSHPKDLHLNSAFTHTNFLYIFSQVVLLQAATHQIFNMS